MTGLFFLFFTLSAQLITTEELATIETLPIDHETLVVFDVDLVLIEPVDPLFKYSAIKQHPKYFRELFSQITREERARLFALFAMGDSELVEESAPDIVASAMERGCRAIACTAMLAEGEAGPCRCRDLADHGFEFTDAGDLTLPHLEFAGVPCLFSEGILFANTLPKGEVLYSLLAELDWEPTRVIIVDDKLENITSVEEWFEGTDFIGVHYLRARNAETEPHDLIQLEAAWRALLEQART